MTPVARRRTVVAVLVGVAVVAAGVGWGAAQLVRSPAQAAADAAPPPPSSITAAVEHRVLRQTLVTRGSVTPAKTVKATLRAPKTGEPVVTAVRVAVGDEIAAGAVLVEIAGRPVLTLHGSIPAYRDLTPGAEGEDVRQLQTALTEMGHPVTANGRYGAGTASAVSAWYRDAGYPAPSAGVDDESRRDAASQQVVAAERALEDLRDAGAATPARQLERAQEDLDGARKRAAEVEASTGASVPASEIVVIDSFPARIREVGVQVGGAAGEGTVTLSTGALGVTATLAAQMTGLVREGQEVELTAEALGQQAHGTVTALLAAAPTSDKPSGTAGNGPRFLVSPTVPLDPAWNTQDVRVTVVAASSEGPVLVVPLAAVSADAGQRTRVVVMDADDDHRHTVEVRTGIVGDGFVQVTPVDADLPEGARVVVGANAGAPRRDA